MEVLSLLFLVSVASAASYRGTVTVKEDPPCGRPNFRGPRIVEGHDAREGEFPWTVSIQSNGEHICGGAIIKQRTILTAGHCVDKSHVAGMDPSTHTLSVVLGTRNLSHMIPGYSQRIHFTKISFHKRYAYEPTTQKTFHDVALIELEEDIEWNRYISPVCLPPHDILFGVKDFPASASGWGQPWGKPWGLLHSLRGHLMIQDFSFSEVLQTISLNIMSNNKCNYLYGKMHNGARHLVQPHELCAGIEEQEVSPWGSKKVVQAAITNRDSGSPLVVQYNGRWTVVGVVKSIPQRAGPGIYSRVSNILSWINEKEKDKSDKSQDHDHDHDLEKKLGNDTTTVL